MRRVAPGEHRGASDHRRARPPPVTGQRTTALTDAHPLSRRRRVHRGQPAPPRAARIAVSADTRSGQYVASRHQLRERAAGVGTSGDGSQRWATLCSFPEALGQVVDVAERSPALLGRDDRRWRAEVLHSRCHNVLGPVAPRSHRRCAGRSSPSSAGRTAPRTWTRSRITAPHAPACSQQQGVDDPTAPGQSMPQCARTSAVQDGARRWWRLRASEGGPGGAARCRVFVFGYASRDNGRSAPMTTVRGTK